MEEINDMPQPGGREIVIVDDNEENILVLRHLLKRLGYPRLTVFSRPQEVIDACQAMDPVPDLYLMDVMMPGIDGITLANQIRKNDVLKHAAIVFVTARHVEETLGSCFEVGGSDLIAKPISMIELRCRLTRVFELQDAQRRLQIQNEELLYCSVRDPLTGLFNRRFLDQRLTDECAKSDRYDHELSFVMCDLDKFKEINDTHGHPVGDRVLKQLAVVLLEAVRSTDLVARLGGEEFCIMLTGTPEEQAFETADRIRKAIESAVFLPERDDRDVTVSMGVAAYRTVKGGPSNLMEKADEALYESKGNGRNLVTLAKG